MSRIKMTRRKLHLSMLFRAGRDCEICVRGQVQSEKKLATKILENISKFSLLNVLNEVGMCVSIARI